MDGGKVQKVMSQSSYVSFNNPRLEFGLGTVVHVDIEVAWPVGTIEMSKNGPPDSPVTIREVLALLKIEAFSNAATNQILKDSL